MDTPESPQETPHEPPPEPLQEAKLPQEEDYEVIARRVKRRLFMGGGLFLAFGSIYGGMLGAPPLLQVGLASLAAACVYVAFRISRD